MPKNFAQWDDTRKSNEKLMTSVEGQMEQLGLDNAGLAERAEIKETVVDNFLDGQTVGHIAVVKIAGALGCELSLVPKKNG